MSLEFCVLSLHVVSEWPALLGAADAARFWLFVDVPLRCSGFEDERFCKTVLRGHGAAGIVRQALAHVHGEFYYVVRVQWSPQCEVLECAFVSPRFLGSSWSFWFGQPC